MENNIILKLGIICTLLCFYQNSYAQTECMSGNCIDGYGVAAVGGESDLIYKGQWKAGKHHGKGILGEGQNAERKVYEGQFKEGNFVQGIYYTESGKIKWEGQWKPNGGLFYGIEYYEINGQKRYEGQWKNNKRNGYGTYYDSNGQKVYAGQWKEDKLISSGNILSVSQCIMTDGDRRFCQTIEIKQASGEIIKGDFWMYVILKRNNKTFYNGPSNGTSRSEQDSYLMNLINRHLKPGINIEMSIACGLDAGCYLDVINIKN